MGSNQTPVTMSEVKNEYYVVLSLMQIGSALPILLRPQEGRVLVITPGVSAET
ncbi:MAG: hypothetical protein J07HQX50_01482 [Haloquadratum sp. J07HQX50]|nr:MAG: hypothetical protein J07HQX50_01482 [Haloquadratum sp. J07HQX50]